MTENATGNSVSAKNDTDNSPLCSLIYLLGLFANCVVFIRVDIEINIRMLNCICIMFHLLPGSIDYIIFTSV